MLSVRGNRAPEAVNRAGESNLDSVWGEAVPGELRHHGDAELGDGLVDFAVNVAAPGPPSWLRAELAADLGRLGAYPTVADELAAREMVARRHGRDPDEVLLLAGAAEGFALLARRAARLAAVVHPSFTEPEFQLRQYGVPVVQVISPAPFGFDPAAVPDAADLVVIGNPTNPTSRLHSRASILALRRPGRLVVVDEAFMDAVPGETESLAGMSLPDVAVVRSLTKTWSLAGLRCGYLLGPVELVRELRRGRPHWPLGTLQLTAIRACSAPAAVAQAQERALQVARWRDQLAADLAGFGPLLPAAAPFLLCTVPDGDRMRQLLRDKGIAVRRGDTFPGLSAGHFRVAVREPAVSRQLVAALREVSR